jgi:hypothetical protein
MKPLSEWTDTGLREWVECCRPRLGRTAAEVLAELLRRERARCVAAVLYDVAEVKEESGTAHIASWLEAAAARIRGLT